MYCNSTDYGKGCRYGPSGVHFHPDDATKCAYCGSTDYGKGCKLNPTGDIHIHGINYNSMFREEIQSFLDMSILLQELKKNFTDFRSYELGITDEKGNKIKVPNTLEEQTAYSPMVKNVLKLKRYLGPKVDLLDAAALLEQETAHNTSPEHYKKCLEYKDKMQSTINELYKVLDEAYADGLSMEEVTKLVRA